MAPGMDMRWNSSIGRLSRMTMFSPPSIIARSSPGSTEGVW